VAYDVPYYDWEERGRWRRWVARLFALLALGACALGVITIVRDATEPRAAAPLTLRAELERISASMEGLSVRLETLDGRSSLPGAREALAAARRDRTAAVQALKAAPAVRSEELVRNALAAQGDYLRLVATVLREPRNPAAGQLTGRARRARAAFRALPDDAGTADAIRGTDRLVAFARARRG
jgi:hypothetical protein